MSSSRRSVSPIQTVTLSALCAVCVFFSFSLSANAMTESERLSFMEGQLSGIAAMLTAFYPEIAGEVLGATAADLAALEVLLSEREARLVVQETRLAKLKALTAPTATQLETIATVEAAIVRIKAQVEKTKADIAEATSPLAAPATPVAPVAPTSGAIATQLREFRNSYLNLTKYSHSITLPSQSTVTLSWSGTLSEDSLKLRIVELSGYGRRATTTVLAEASIDPTSKQYVWSSARAGNFTVEFTATKYGVEKIIKLPITVVDSAAPSTVELNKFKYGRFMMGKTIFELKQPASTTVDFTWTDTLNADSVSIRIEETMMVGRIASTTVLVNESVDPAARKYTWANPKAGFFKVILTGKRYGTQMETAVYVTVRDVTAYLAPSNFAVNATWTAEPQITWIDTLGAENVKLVIDRLTNPYSPASRHVYEPVITLNPAPANRTYVLMGAPGGSYRATLTGSRYGRAYSAQKSFMVIAPPAKAETAKGAGTGQQVSNSFSISGVESKNILKAGQKGETSITGTTQTVKWSNVAKVTPVVFTAKIQTKSQAYGKNAVAKTIESSRVVATASSTGDKLTTTFTLPADATLASLEMSGVLDGKLMKHTHYVTDSVEVGHNGKSESDKGWGGGGDSNTSSSQSSNSGSNTGGTKGGFGGLIGNYY